MKIGIKFYPEHIEEALKAGADLAEVSRKVDFMEIMSKNEGDFSFLKDIACPITIHMDHHKGNLCDPGGEEGSREAVRFAIELADRVKSDIIVLHPGYNVNGKCSLENTIKLMKEFPDRRLHIENMPFRDKGKGFFGRTPGEIKSVMDETGCRFCLDFSHAAASAYGMGREYLGFVKSFLPIKPSYFHLHDSPIKSELCRHLHLGDGELDIKAFKQMVPEGSWVCLETLARSGLDLPRSLEDVELLRKL